MKPHSYNVALPARRSMSARAAAGTATVLLLLLALALAPSARADDDDLFPIPAMTDAAWAGLEQDARANGTIPVIVALAVGARAEHALNPEKRAMQRTAIARARDDVFAGLRGKGRNVLKTADTMPLLTLMVDVDDLVRLRRSKRVAAVTRDHEIALDGSFAARAATERKAGTPENARPLANAGTPAATSSNGAANQLPEWWDWYKIGVNTARGWGHTGSGQLIAVLDTGVDRSHAWLSGKVVNEACFAQRTTGSTAGDCPNGASTQLGYGAAAPCSYDYLCAHGTHVAHTAAGTWGVASGAEIMAVQVFHRGTSGKPTYFESDVIWGLKHVYDQRGYYRIAAVNMSIGGTTPDGFLYGGYCDNGPGDNTINATYMAGWINALKGVGIATTVSSGNDNSATGTRRPSCIANAISVGNTTVDTAGSDAVYGYVSGGSNSNTTVDLLAPGTDICSAVPANLDNDGNADGVGCGWIGTSMAAPHVAGAIAVARAFRPGLTGTAATVDSIQSALQRSGTAVTDSRNSITRTRIHVANLLYYL